MSPTLSQYTQVIVPPALSIQLAMEKMNSTGLGILLIADGDEKLLGVLTDGDFRRAVLRGVSMSEECLSIASRDPLIGPVGISAAEARALMNYSRPFLINHLPLVDENRRLAGLILRGNLSDEQSIGVQALVMAGGFGQRLMPLTQDTPKPMLEVGGRPLLERIIDNLQHAGIHEIYLSVHYHADIVREHFGDGSAFGVHITYVDEATPMGTAGAIGLLPPLGVPLLVMNGDILTQVNIRRLVEFHREHKAGITVCLRRYDIGVPYGVVDVEGVKVQTIREKPQLEFFVNAGIYIVESSVANEHVPKGKKCDMPDLIKEVIECGNNVVGFPVTEYWLDIGQLADYTKANEDIDRGVF